MMGTCICMPNMQGFRCARLRQRMEIELVKQLGFCTIEKGFSPLWRPKLSFETFVLAEGPIDSVLSRKHCYISLGAAGLAHSSSPLTSYRGRSQFSLTPGSGSLDRWAFPAPSPKHASHGLLVWGHPGGSASRFSSGLSCPTRVASAPRVTSFQPDKAWVESQRLCPGCGIEMQEENPKAPGFFQRPVQVKRFEDDEDAFGDASDHELEIVGGSEPEGRRKDWVVTSFPEFDDDDHGSGASRRAGRRPGRRNFGQDRAEASESARPTVCARCHALRNYGRVKDESVENLLPDFDFEHVVGSRLRKSIGRRAVVLMVIDSVDFDGSFPRMAATLLADADRELGNSWQEGKAANVPRLLIVLNKVDLLPGQLSPVRLEQWARRRSRAGGVTQISGVHIVSAFKGWGVDKLCKQITEMAGPRGDVWVIGAQNVGKSSLINALGKLTVEGADGKKNVFLTEAALPGTTIGVLKLEGILPSRARLLDTPGLLHPHQITTRLTFEEQKMVQIRKVLKPRTFRVKVGHAISLGGLMRLTVKKAPAESIYATIWASPHIPCHMGKADSAQELFDKHIGEKLQPPLSKERVDELGRWVARTVQVSGNRWDKSSVDVAVAGVGWIALALSGSAVLEVWTYEGVAVTVRDAMVLDLALVMERPGFMSLKHSVKGKN